MGFAWQEVGKPKAPANTSPSAVCVTCDPGGDPPAPPQPPALDSQFVSQTVPAVMVAGTTQTVSIQLKNTGTTPWDSSNLFRLGSQNPGDNTTWGMGRVLLPTTVAYGQTVTITFTIKAPTAGGTYNFQWRMVQDTVAWFGATTPNVAIKVLSGSVGANPNPCDIPSGSVTCTSNLSWNSNSSTSEVWVSGLDGSSPQLFARSQNGLQSASWISTNGSRFSLKSDGLVMASVDVRGNAPPPPPVVTETSSTDYDELGRVMARRDSAGHVIASYTYDAEGNVIKVTDALQRTTTLEYDAFNRIAKSTDAASGVTYYAYDGADRLTQVTDPRGKVTAYTYDGFGQLWTLVSPDTGTTSYVYDTGGLRTGLTRNDGSTLTFAYDALGRIASVGNGQEVRTYSYDSCTNGKGRLCRMTGAAGGTIHSWTNFAYTPEGWLSSRTDAMQNTQNVTGYSYDAMGRVTGIGYPSGVSVGYAYGYGKLSAVTVTAGGATTTAASGFRYQPFGAASEWLYGNGLQRSVGYDAEGRITTLRASTAATVAQSLTYGHDMADQITSIANDVDATQNRNYAYDALGRVSQETRNGWRWYYDANGNRNRLTVPGGETDYTIDAASNRLLSAVALTGMRTDYQYDARGNRSVAKEQPGIEQRYGYDAFNRLTSITTTANGTTQTLSLLYNAQDQRVGKIGPGGAVRFIYSGDQLIAEYGPSGWKSYVWLGSGLGAVVAGNGTVYFVHNDHLGRPEAATNAARQIVWQARNGAFGRDVTQDQIGGLNIGFPGQYQDVETGLWINGYRTYDENVGRYLESDPLELLAGINTYAYVDGNPLNGVDPLGLATVVIYSGPTAGNPFGHIAIAMTGLGVFSYGTSDPYGGSTTAYISSQLAQGRSVSVAIIPYTLPEAEAAIAASMRTNHKADYRVASKNCSTAVGYALNAGGIPVQSEALPGDTFNQISAFPGVQVFPFVSQPGGGLPDLSSFNRR